MISKTVLLLFLIVQLVWTAEVVLANTSNNVADESFTLVTRKEWDSLCANDTRPLATPVPYVVIHHTYTPGACFNQSACSKSMRGMQNYHAGLGWGDIGYNFCVGSDGSAYEGRGWRVVGIHTGKMNSISVGICLIGDWRIETPPLNQLQTTKALIASGVASGIIREDYRLIGHDQAMPTECPGAALQREIATWKHFYNGTGWLD